MHPPARIASYIVEDGVKHLRFRLARPVLLLSCCCSCLRIGAGDRQGQKCIPEQEETCQLPQRIAGGAVYIHTCVYSTLGDTYKQTQFITTHAPLHASQPVAHQRRHPPPSTSPTAILAGGPLVVPWLEPPPDFGLSTQMQNHVHK